MFRCLFLLLPRFASSKSLKASSLLEEKSEEVSTRTFEISLGSYGVVFKASRTDDNDVD